MSVWRNYLKQRRLREGLADGHDPVDKFKFNTDDEDFAEDHEKVQQELIKTVLNKYPEETMDFLSTIANRGDEEVSSLLRRLRKERGSRLPREPQHPSSGDEVVPSSADVAHNPEGGDDGY